MFWVDRLNRTGATLRFTSGSIDVLNWSYASHLPDNVPHKHTYFEVCQVGAYGSGYFSAAGEDHRICPGSVFFARPGAVHQIRNAAQSEMELFWVSFQWAPLNSDAPDEVLDLMRTFQDSAVWTAPDTDGRIAYTWRALRAAAAELRPGAANQIDCLQRALVLGIMQLGSGDSSRIARNPGLYDPDNSLARLAVRYIHDNLERPLVVNEVASHVAVCSRHLSRVFDRFTGSTPAAYISNVRMDRARSLLLTSDASIKEIASSVGYPDVHHFTRVFARRYGSPPGLFRRTRGGDVRNMQNTDILV